MRLIELTIEQLRCLGMVSLEPASGLNFLMGDNGAGKTSILEAIHLLASGRSFRSNQHDVLVQRGRTELRVVVKLFTQSSAQTQLLGLERSPRAWRAKLDGQEIDRLSELFLRLPVVCFEPDSHVLISGGSENRRQFLDWALFHVEPSFIRPWRRYQRALKQRNKILKQTHDDASLGAWEIELAEQGEQLDHLRSSYLDTLKPEISAMAGRFLPELGELQVSYQRGWNSDESDLKEALSRSRERDVVLGYTTVGAHRSDWSLGFVNAPHRSMFSRGQEKLVVLACLMAQASNFSKLRGEWPILLLDDLPSELDPQHLQHTLTWLGSQDAQVFVTLTQPLMAPLETKTESRWFHVEQGQVRALV